MISSSDIIQVNLSFARSVNRNKRHDTSYLVKYVNTLKTVLGF